MKQKIYISGIVIALIIFTGAIFKVNHLPGAGILLSLGLITMVLLFLPLALINHYKSEESNHNMSLYLVTWLTCFVVFTSMLFKLQHWPYAGLLLTVAIPFPYVVFLPVFLVVTSRNKNFNIYNTVLVLLMLALNSVFSALLSLNVAKDRIDDSYDLAKKYVVIESVLEKMPNTDTESSVNNKIDDVIKIIDQYQAIILNFEGMSVQQWRNTPGNLLRSASGGIASLALLNSGEPEAGARLEKALTVLIQEMKNTPGYEDFAKAAPGILNFWEPARDKSSWTESTFNDSLAWALIYLDGIKTNLLMIKLAPPSL